MFIRSSNITPHSEPLPPSFERLLRSALSLGLDLRYSSPTLSFAVFLVR